MPRTKSNVRHRQWGTGSAMVVCHSCPWTRHSTLSQHPCANAMQCGPMVMVWRTQDWGPTTAIMEYLNVTLQVTYYQDTALAEISKVFTPPTPHTHTYIWCYDPALRRCDISCDCRETHLRMVPGAIAPSALEGIVLAWLDKTATRSLHGCGLRRTAMHLIFD